MAFIKPSKGANNKTTLKRTWFSHLGDIHSQLKWHEAKDRENGKTSKKAGQTIEHGQAYSISVIGEDCIVSCLTAPGGIWKQNNKNNIFTCSSCCCICYSFQCLSHSFRREHLRTGSDSQHRATPSHFLKAHKRTHQWLICIIPASVSTQISPEDQPDDLCQGKDSNEFLVKLRAVSDLESAWPTAGGKESWR